MVREPGVDYSRLIDAKILVRANAGQRDRHDCGMGGSREETAAFHARHAGQRQSEFEIVKKALAAGIPILASVSSPSRLAFKLARELGLTLIGFLRGRRFVVYSGESWCFPAGRPQWPPLALRPSRMLFDAKPHQQNQHSTDQRQPKENLTISKWFLHSSSQKRIANRAIKDLCSRGGFSNLQIQVLVSHPLVEKNNSGRLSAGS
jgi:hypothetical protein